MAHEIEWSHDQLERGNTELMDTPTYLEWLQRQLETEEETQAREDERARLHAKWHETAPGIYACCLRSAMPGPPT